MRRVGAGRQSSDALTMGTCRQPCWAQTRYPVGSWALPAWPPPWLVPSWATVKIYFGDWEENEPGSWGISGLTLHNFLRALGSVPGQPRLGRPIPYMVPGASPSSHRWLQRPDPTCGITMNRLHRHRSDVSMGG